MLTYLTGGKADLFGQPGGDQTPEPVLRAAALLLLQDRSDDGGISAWSRLHARPSFKSLASRLHLSWSRTGRAGPAVAAASPLTKAGAMLRALGNRADRREIARSAAVYRWLERGPDPV